MTNSAKKVFILITVLLFLSGSYLIWKSLTYNPDVEVVQIDEPVKETEEENQVLGAVKESGEDEDVQAADETETVTQTETEVEEEEPEDIVIFPAHEASIHMVEDEKYSKEDYNFIQLRSPSEVTPSAHAIPANVNNDREIMGFLPYWQLSNYDQLQYDKLSTIAYFSLTTNGSGGWITNDSGYSGFYSASFTNMLAKARENDVKVVVVAKNFDATSIRKIVSNTDGAGDRLIDNIVDVIRVRGLDGVNVDFEYLGTVDSTLRANFVAWHDKLAKRVHSEFPGSHVSTDVFGSSSQGVTAYDLVGLGKTDIDYIMMMTYDYITTSCSSGKRMIPLSPLYGNGNWSVSYHVGLAVEQAPRGKIIMGVPYYGIDFRVMSDDSSIYNARVDYPNCQPVIETYSQITNPIYDQWHNTSALRWHDGEKARWYRYNYNGNWRHGYYDDERSLDAKYDFARAEQVGGIGIWALGYDAGRSELWTALRDNFQTGPFIVGFTNTTSFSTKNSILSQSKLELVEQINDNVWKVRPTSGLSYDAMVTVRRYPQVTSADFESARSSRTID